MSCPIPSILLLFKSIYTLLILYIESDSLLLTNALILCVFLSLFNHSLAFLLHSNRKEVKWEMVLWDLFFSLIISWFLVVVAGGNPFDLHSVSLALLLSSTAFNLLTIQPYKNSDTLSSLSKLNLRKLSSTPKSMILTFASLGSLIGTLLTGLAVILDWDVEWKKFPIPNIVGCIFGELCGILVSMIIFLSFTVLLK